MDDPAPIALVHRIEVALEGEAPDQIIFAMGLVLGRVVAFFAAPEDHAEVVEACHSAIQLGIRESLTETKGRA